MTLYNNVVNTVYLAVIENVIENITDIFTDEGVDEQILHKLEALWKTKLLENCKSVNQSKNTQVFSQSNVERSTHGVKRKVQESTLPKIPINSVTQGKKQTLNTLSRAIQPRLVNEIIPLQVTVPMLPIVNSSTRVLTIHVPAYVVNQSQLHNLLTGPVITATMGLPTSLARTLLQQHVNAAIQKHQQQQQVTVNRIIMPQIDGESDEPPQISENTIDFKKVSKCANSSTSMNIPAVFLNVDGAPDTSDEEKNETEDYVSDDEEKDDAEAELHSTVSPPEEILNSDDDITDDESDNQMDTNNIIVCQYDKIARSRNKWKLYLKDGVMNVDGEEFIFHGLMGEAEW